MQVKNSLNITTFKGFIGNFLQKVSLEISHKSFIGNLLPIPIQFAKDLHLSIASLL